MNFIMRIMMLLWLNEFDEICQTAGGKPCDHDNVDRTLLYVLNKS